MNRRVTKQELDPFDDDVGSFYDGANGGRNEDDSLYHPNRQASRQRKAIDFDDDLSDKVSEGNNNYNGGRVINNRQDDEYSD